MYYSSVILSPNPIGYDANDYIIDEHYTPTSQETPEYVANSYVYIPICEIVESDNGYDITENVDTEFIRHYTTNTNKDGYVMCI